MAAAAAQPNASQGLLNSNLFNAQDLAEDWAASSGQQPNAGMQMPNPSPNRVAPQTGLPPTTPGQSGMQLPGVGTPSSDPPTMAREMFWSQVNKTFQSRNQAIPAAEVGGRQFDAYTAYCIVSRLGGVRQVSERKDWMKVAAQLGLLSADPNEGHTNAGVAAALQQFYLATCVETENAWRIWWMKKQQNNSQVDAQRNLLAMQLQNARQSQQQAAMGQIQSGQGLQPKLDGQDLQSQPADVLHTLRTALQIIEPSRLQYLRTEVSKLSQSELHNLGLPPQELLFVRHCLSNPQLVDMALRAQLTPVARLAQPAENTMAGPAPRAATAEEAQNATYMLGLAYRDVRAPSQ